MASVGPTWPATAPIADAEVARGDAPASLDPALADALGPVRTGPGRLTAARFAVTQFLLGCGGDDAAALRAWYRRHWWVTTVQRIGRPRALLSVVKTPARILRDVLQAVRAHGRACEAAHGVPVATQFRRLLWLAATRGVETTSFYDLWLFRPARGRRASRYVQWHEAAVLYRVLTAREAPNDFILLEDKRVFARWCAEHGLPTPPVLAEFRDGALVRAAAEPSFALPERDLFSKPSDQYGGAGVRRWRHVARGRWVDHESGASYDADALCAALAEQSRGGVVILQLCLVNDERLRPVAPVALGTLRLLTARPPDGPPEVALATFRTGAGGSASDNFSSGGIAVSVDLATGRLRRGVRRDDGQMVVGVDAHPDTCVPFEGFALPSWDAATALALAAHARLGAMAFVGWDVAFTPDGIVLLEGNYNPGVRIVQAGWGAPLGDTNFVRYLDAHLRRSFARA